MLKLLSPKLPHGEDEQVGALVLADDSFQLVRAVLRDVEGLQRALTVQQLVPNCQAHWGSKQTTPTMAQDFSSSYEEGNYPLKGFLPTTP